MTSFTVPAMHLHPGFCSSVTKARPECTWGYVVCFPKKGKRSAEWRTWRLPGTVVGTAPVTGNSRVPHDKGRSPFGAPQRIVERFHSTRPGPALPGIIGSTAKRASPTPVQQAPCSPITCRTGMMPRPSANRSDWPPSAEPAPAPSKVVSAVDVPHDERVGSVCSQGADPVKELIPCGICADKTGVSCLYMLMRDRGCVGILEKRFADHTRRHARPCAGHPRLPWLKVVALGSELT
jgi:hypothetical protein